MTRVQLGGNPGAYGMVAIHYRKSRMVPYIGYGPFEVEALASFQCSVAGTLMQ